MPGNPFPIGSVASNAYDAGASWAEDLAFDVEAQRVEVAREQRSRAAAASAPRAGLAEARAQLMLLHPTASDSDLDQWAARAVSVGEREAVNAQLATVDQAFRQDRADRLAESAASDARVAASQTPEAQAEWRAKLIADESSGALPFVGQ